MHLCFIVANNVVPVEDIVEMNNVDNTITEADRYNARIWFHYIAWNLNTLLDNLNEVNNVFTWMQHFTQGFHKMAKAGIFKISNDKTVRKWHVLFKVK